MKFNVGDKVKYVYNIPFMGETRLLKRVTGIVTGYYWGTPRSCDHVVMVDWTTMDGQKFRWNMPDNYVKSLEANEISILS